MNEDTKVVIRDGQWLGSGDVFADFGDKEVIVALDAAALDHRLLAELPDNEQGQSVRTSREAMHLAGLAATHAQARGRIDDDGRIVVEVEDLEAAA